MASQRGYDGYPQWLHGTYLLAYPAGGSTQNFRIPGSANQFTIYVKDDRRT